MEFLSVFSIILPIVFGILGYKVPWKKQKYFLVFVFAVNLLLVSLCSMQQGVWKALEFSNNLSITFMFDGIGKFFAMLVAIMWGLVGCYSYEYMGHEENRERFYFFYLASLGTLNGICFAGNYVTLYCFFELMTLLSMPMVLHSEKQDAIDAAKKYLLYSVFGASLGLAGYFFLTYYGTSTTFTAGGVLDMAKVAGNETLVLSVALMTIIGFGAKAGMMPLHAWLPTAHPVAPSCASAVLSGVITKAGVFAIIRVVYFQFGVDFIAGTWVQTVWIVLSLLTVLTGSMLAYKEKLLKKRLAYSTVSQVSYILFGLACCNEVAFVGAMLHVVAHSLIKNVLFMSAGAIIVHGNCTKVDELKGIGKTMPKTMVAFTIASLGLVGIPPFIGFVSKWYLAQGALQSLAAPWNFIGPAVLLASALLTAGYLFTITIDAFFKDGDHQGKEAGAWMLVPMMVCCVLIFVGGLFPQAILNLLMGGM
ncbi:MAG: proton-conducting transporter membrane subunit [Cellulosilyticum sp.]|nr:proton-conducting transporter membrane subunit [Cellulosilyticum sp.]